MISVIEISKYKWRPISTSFSLDSSSELDEIVLAISEVCSSLESKLNPFCDVVINDEKLVFRVHSNKSNWIGISKVSVELRKEIKFEYRDWSQSFISALSNYQRSNPESNIEGVCEYLKISIESNNVSVFISSNEDVHEWCFAWGHKFEQHADHFLHDEAVRPESFEHKEKSASTSEDVKSFERYTMKVSDPAATLKDFKTNDDSSMKNFVISNSILLGWFSVFVLLLGFLHWFFTN